MKRDWIEIGELASLPEGQATLKKAGGRRFVCVRRGEQVDALDDRCPHQGYPLSEGAVANGELTCAWHNWKFDIATGACTFGGDAARRYPARVEGGRVHLDVTIDVDAEAKRFADALRAALADDDVGRATREGLRLGALAPGASLGAIERALGVLVEDAAARAEYGFDHPLAMTADLASWVERGWIGGAEALAVAAAAVGDASKHLARRPRSDRAPDDALAAPRATHDDLVAERRADAEARVRALVRDQGAAFTAREALLPFVARHVLDYGHGAIYLTKALELATRFPSAAEELLAASAVELSWATADTALPPFGATRGALERLASIEPGERADGFDRAALEDAILGGEKRGVASVLDAIEAKSDPREVLFAVAHAAAVRLARFEAAWEDDPLADVGVLDVSHAVTFAEAAVALAKDADPRIAARFAVLGAGFTGKLKRADRHEPRAIVPRDEELLDAVRARDLEGSLARGRALDADARRDAYRKIAPFAALEGAVRPIFQAHYVKITEACRRLDHVDPRADGAYLDACLTIVAARRRERNYRRVAATASKFLEDGRPPESLY